MLGGFTFTLSMPASIFSCSTAFLACEMLAVLLLDMPSFMLGSLQVTTGRGLECDAMGPEKGGPFPLFLVSPSADPPPLPSRICSLRRKKKFSLS